VTPAASREPRSLPPGRALQWFGEAIRLWKRGPLAFSLMALVVIASALLLEPLPVIGVVVANVVSPLLTCGLLFASLAADGNDRPRFRHMFMAFASPLSAQFTVIVAALLATLVASAFAWSMAGVNLLVPGSASIDVPPSVTMVIFAIYTLVSLPLTFVPMAALFDSEPLRMALASSLRAFARNPQPMLALGAYTYILVLAGFATTGVGLVLALPWIAAAQYAAWKDIYDVTPSGGGAPGEVA
jgi:hypothetical protein